MMMNIEGNEVSPSVATAETPEYICEKKIWDIIDRINERLLVLGINRSQLAESMSVSRSAVTQFLSGHNTFNIKTLAKLSAAMDSDVDWLFTGSDSERCLSCSRGSTNYILVHFEESKPIEKAPYPKGVNFSKLNRPLRLNDGTSQTLKETRTGAEVAA